MTDEAQVGVIGAGISGLSAALAVVRAGRSVVLLESSGAPGGVIRSGMQMGFVVEDGPNSFHSSDRTEALIKSLGIDGEKVYAQSDARRRYVVRGGRVHDVPLSPSALLKSKLLTTAGKARALADLVIAAQRNGAEESLGSLVRRRLGQEVLSYLVDPFVSGVYAGDPWQLSSSFTLPMLGRFERDHGSVLRGLVASMRKRDVTGSRKVTTSLRSGMQLLPLSIGAELGTALRLNHRVTSVRQNGDRWILSGHASQGPFSVSVAQLIIATAANTMKDIEWPHELQRDLHRVMSVKYAPLATVAMGFRRSQVAHALDGFGALVPSVEMRGIIGVLFNSSTFCCRAPDEHVLVTAFLGGARQETLPPSPILEDIALRELQQLLGVRGDPVMVSTSRLPAAIPQFEVGHGEVVDTVARIGGQYAGLQLVGSYIDGVSINECVERGQAAGARAVGALAHS